MRYKFLSYQHVTDAGIKNGVIYAQNIVNSSPVSYGHKISLITLVMARREIPRAVWLPVAILRIQLKFNFQAHYKS